MIASQEITRKFSTQRIQKEKQKQKFIQQNRMTRPGLIFYDWKRVALQATEAIHVSTEKIGRRIAIRRSGIDRDVNFAKKIPSFVKMNTESINLMGNPSDFVEAYFKKTLNF